MDRSDIHSRYKQVLYLLLLCSVTMYVREKKRRWLSVPDYYYARHYCSSSPTGARRRWARLDHFIPVHVKQAKHLWLAHAKFAPQYRFLCCGTWISRTAGSR